MLLHWKPDENHQHIILYEVPPQIEALVHGHGGGHGGQRRERASRFVTSLEAPWLVDLAKRGRKRQKYSKTGLSPRLSALKVITVRLQPYIQAQPSHQTGLTSCEIR